jgi:hypothetical protein
MLSNEEWQRMKKRSGDSKANKPIFGTTPRTLSAEELDRVFGGQAGPPAPTPTPTPTPTQPGSGPYPWPSKPRGGYDYYGQES